jgi:hypothetical protein
MEEEIEVEKSWKESIGFILDKMSKKTDDEWMIYEIKHDRENKEIKFIIPRDQYVDTELRLFEEYLKACGHKNCYFGESDMIVCGLLTSKPSILVIVDNFRKPYNIKEKSIPFEFNCFEVFVLLIVSLFIIILISCLIQI